MNLHPSFKIAVSLVKQGQHISFRLHTSNQRISRELLLKQSRQGNKDLKQKPNMTRPITNLKNLLDLRGSATIASRSRRNTLATDSVGRSTFEPNQIFSAGTSKEPNGSQRDTRTTANQCLYAILRHSCEPHRRSDDHVSIQKKITRLPPFRVSNPSKKAGS